MLNNSSESGHSCLVSDFKGKPLPVIIKYKVSSRFFTVFKYLEISPGVSHYSKQPWVLLVKSGIFNIWALGILIATRLLLLLYLLSKQSQDTREYICIQTYTFLFTSLSIVKTWIPHQHFLFQSSLTEFTLATLFRYLYLPFTNNEKTGSHCSQYTYLFNFPVCCEPSKPSRLLLYSDSLLHLSLAALGCLPTPWVCIMAFWLKILSTLHKCIYFCFNRA